MRIAVTGASGTVGRAFVKAAHDAGHTLLLLGRQRPVGMDDLAYYHHVDLDERGPAPELVDALKGVDVVLHLAARIDTNPKDDDAALALFNTNVLGTGYLIGLLGLAQVERLVVASSANIYDPRVEVADEETPIRPLSRTLYLTSKAAQEAYAREQCQTHGIHCAIARLSSVVATGDDIVTRLATKISCGEPVTLSNPEYGADFIALDDVVQGLLIIIDQKLEGDFNISTGKRRTLLQIVDIIAQRLKKSPQLRGVGETQTKDQGFPAIDCSRLRQRGFAAQPLAKVIDRLCLSLDPTPSEARKAPLR
ncbi:MAG: NAD(P)-dependent oxidoreductase [Erythrobacter sp.]|uniref:NAD-dependent epimerase/dehydratase family protein n=1 Tax=Erythrobacter sp. TaxID=1042 RepID=UPI002618C355|nr:NAD(P)-dependent oxidoreductase [Erythrobacter sp.]MDJ0978680.1 NAD(P)-dependent oxidoreductase [Erythrobacter sp.]